MGSRWREGGDTYEARAGLVLGLGRTDEEGAGREKRGR